MEHPKRVGDRAVLAVLSGLYAAGFEVSVPFGENTRYDLLIDDGRVISRVQCKNGRLRGGAIQFNTCSSYAHHPNPKTIKRSYEGEIDYFGIYCAEVGTVYLVPIDDVQAHRVASLRHEPSRNNQVVGVRLAQWYEIANVSVTPTRALRATSGA